MILTFFWFSYLQYNVSCNRAASTLRRPAMRSKNAGGTAAACTLSHSSQTSSKPSKATIREMQLSPSTSFFTSLFSTHPDTQKRIEILEQF